jgi:hypothetical protein
MEVKTIGSSKLLPKGYFRLYVESTWDVYAPRTRTLVTRMVVVALGLSRAQQQVFDRLLTHINGREHKKHRLSER